MIRYLSILKGECMHLTWKNIDKAILKELDSWIRLDDNIKKYAMFDYSFTAY